MWCLRQQSDKALGVCLVCLFLTCSAFRFSYDTCMVTSQRGILSLPAVTLTPWVTWTLAVFIKVDNEIDAKEI